MSNLSELLPAGAGAKSADFVASGTLSSGQTVILKSDGTVEAISGSVRDTTVGTPVVFESASAQYVSSTYDPVSQKIIIAYSDYGNSLYGTAIVGTVSGSSISFGAPAIFNSTTSIYVRCTYDTNSQKVVICFRNGGNSNYGTTVIGTVSGTSISFGSLVVFNSGATLYGQPVYDSNTNKVVVAYQDTSNSNYGTARVGTVSGTSISFGSEIVFNSASTLDTWTTYDINAQKVVIVYSNDGNSGYGTAIVGTVSGTSISFGSPVVFQAAGCATISSVYDSNSQKIIVGYWQYNNSSYLTAVVGTVSGTSISFGSPTEITTSVSTPSITYDSSANKVVLAYRDGNNSNYGTAVFGTVSGTSISFESPIVYEDSYATGMTSIYDANAEKVVVSYTNTGNSNYGTSSVIQVGYVNSNFADFIGITDQAIADTATGAVIVQGGVITNTGLIPYTGSSGSPVTYMSTGGFYSSLSYDTNANKIVVANRKDSPSNYGVAFVGTVSGTSISFGAEATFNAANSDNISSVFDSNSNKVVIAYSDVGNSSHGTVVVGTVSGTTISFGTAVVFEAAAVQGISIAFDSTNNKVVIFYEDDANNDYGTAVVGTVSGTSISFGTPVVFDSVNMQITGGEAAVYDSANNRAVIFYRNSNYEGYAAVGTVSGTSISFGTPVKFSSGAAELNYISATFDSAANKIVTSYRVNNDSGYGKAIVGTVSGTSISFGLESTFESASTNFTSSTFNSTLNQVVISYSDAGNSNYGTFVIATVSGTNISFSTPAVFSSTTAAQYIATTFDSDTNNLVSSYADSAASYHPKSVVTSFLNDLTIGTDYYVQSDGSLSTTTSTVPAGRALSSTSILLEG